MNAEDLNSRIRKTLRRGRVAQTRASGCPQIPLWLFDPAVLEGPLTHDEAQAVVASPAYWSFCWASGQVLASYLLDNPELVEGKTLMDVGSGSGIVAIAAALAGADKVIACDIDDDAGAAIRANAHLNDVDVEVVTDWTSVEPEVIVAADILYDRDNLTFLEQFRRQCQRVVMADSRIRNLPDKSYNKVATVSGRTWPDLNEFEEFNEVRIYIAEGRAAKSQAK